MLRDRNESVDVALFLLAVSPHTCHCLVVIGRVPVRIKHNETIGSDQIQATPTGLAAEHEDVIWALTQTIPMCELMIPKTTFVLTRCFEGEFAGSRLLQIQLSVQNVNNKKP